MTPSTRQQAAQLPEEGVAADSGCATGKCNAPFLNRLMRKRAWRSFQAQFKCSSGQMSEAQAGSMKSSICSLCAWSHSLTRWPCIRGLFQIKNTLRLESLINLSERIGLRGFEKLLSARYRRTKNPFRSRLNNSIRFLCKVFIVR
jgi:hypothetical protein